MFAKVASGFACGDHGVHLTGSLAFHHCEAELQGGGLIVRPSKNLELRDSKYQMLTKALV